MTSDNAVMKKAYLINANAYLSNSPSLFFGFKNFKFNRVTGKSDPFFI